MKKTDDNLKWLIENFNYIDSVTVIDNAGRIIAKKRFNPRYSDEENIIDNEWALNKNLLEVFPSLNHEDSSLLQALQTGKIIYYKGQEVWNHLGRKVVTNNITFPMVSRGQIVGAVEISRDVTHIENKLGVKAKAAVPKTNHQKGRAKYSLGDIITRNPVMQEIKRTILQIANSKSAVMVYGETGTGKELIVSAIHNASYRKNKPFVPVNCAALPENILEGLLFGSRKGAFTGAENKKGLFEEADGGTIYLDEINSMPIVLQAKLLRVLQEKTVLPLGASKAVDVDVRIIASTNQPVEKLISSGNMREDLLYRLNTISIDIPPLRHRPEDIETLVNYFVEKYNQEFEKNVIGISHDALVFCVNHPWKGNVRELEHAVEAAMNMAGSNEELSLEHFPAYLVVNEQRELPSRMSQDYGVSLTSALESYEKKLIIDALKLSDWKITGAADRLQIPRTSLQYKMEKYHIKKDGKLSKKTETRQK